MKQTPSQTVGPYFAYGLTPEQYGYDFKALVGNEMVNPLEHADTITIVGKITDGNGEVIPDAMVELWQNDGQQALFGRCGTGTGAESRFTFRTVKPKALPNQAPYFTLIIFMRGLLHHTYTRIYFPEDAQLNEKDEVLNMIPAERRNTLIATKTATGYEFNIHMQGKNETVFFEILTKE